MALYGDQAANEHPYLDGKLAVTVALGWVMAAFETTSLRGFHFLPRPVFTSPFIKSRVKR